MTSISIRAWGEDCSQSYARRIIVSNERFRSIRSAQTMDRPGGMRVELRQLETFRAVATALSFTRAAAALGYAQSSVTAQIQALETELGVRLFDRLGRHVALTDAGDRLLQYAERLLSLAE